MASYTGGDDSEVMTVGVPPREEKTSPRRTKAQIRRANACKLRARGWEWEQIQKRLKYSSIESVRRDVRRELRESVRENADELLELELMQLRQLQRRALALAMQDDEDGNAKSANLFAMDRILAIMERRAKYLGLDQVASNTDGSAVDRWLAGIMDDSAEDLSVEVDDFLPGVDDEVGELDE